MEKEIKGGTVTVDDVDADLLMGHRWRRNNCGVVVCVRRRQDGAQELESLTLSRMITERVLGRPLRKRERATTWNGDNLDLTRENVVLASVRYAKVNAFRMGMVMA